VTLVLLIGIAEVPNRVREPQRAANFSEPGDGEFALEDVRVFADAGHLVSLK
jgi:hypothetical protein